jgi:hypothetical protein
VRSEIQNTNVTTEFDLILHVERTQKTSIMPITELSLRKRYGDMSDEVLGPKRRRQTKSLDGTITLIEAIETGAT